MGEEAIVEYENMIAMAGGGQTERFRVWMGRMILYCDAQDARLE
jgi:hypothetical protein